MLPSSAPVLFSGSWTFTYARSRLYNATKQEGWYFTSCAMTSPTLSLARSIPSLSAFAHSFILLFTCIVIASLSSPPFSQKKHSCILASWTFRGILLLPPSSLVPAGVYHFSALCNFVLLNRSLQLSWYRAFFCLNVSSIPPPSSSLAGSSLIGSALSEWNRGIFFAKFIYPPSPLLAGLAWGDFRSSFLTSWHRQHLVQSVFHDFPVELASMVSMTFNFCPLPPSCVWHVVTH